MRHWGIGARRNSPRERARETGNGEYLTFVALAWVDDAAAGTTLPAPAPTHYVPSGVSMPAAYTTATTTRAPPRQG